MRLFFLLIGCVVQINADGNTSRRMSSKNTNRFDAQRSPKMGSLDEVATTRIFGGEHAKLGQFPYQVLFIGRGSNFSLECGGSLISPKWVLTAGHCLATTNYWKIKIGGVGRLNITEAGQYRKKSRHAIVHPNYTRIHLKNDIGLIKLRVPVVLSDNIKIVRLPSRSEVNLDLSGLTLTVSGWGQTTSDTTLPGANYLNYVSLKAIPNDECIAKIGLKEDIHDSTLCCIGSDKSICNGDSGSPLVRTASDGEMTQVGFVQFGRGEGCSLGYPVGFGRTASFLDWISENTGIAIRP